LAPSYDGTVIRGQRSLPVERTPRASGVRKRSPQAAHDVDL